MFGKEEVWFIPGDPEWTFELLRKPPIRPLPALPERQEPEPRPTKVVDEPAQRPRRRSAWAVALQSKVNEAVKGRMPPGDVQNLEAILGYSITDLRAHLERQFAKGMTWANYAGHNPYRTKCKTWVIDHIVAKSRFHKDDAARAFALTNLRPLWIKDNLRKGSSRTHML